MAGRTRTWWWRWRGNPLRRREDVLEAWLVLAVWVIMAVGGTVAGVATAQGADGVFARQRAGRTPVRAVLLVDTPRATAHSFRSPAAVRWTAPDGSVHTGKTLVESGRRVGSAVEVWTDVRGDLVTAPPSRTEASVESGLLGAASAFGVSGVVFGVGSVLRRGLDRRRLAQWDVEWGMVGPRWGHRTG
ncbi:hypothetical protein [Streptomyces sp. 351MFTsu5.1]|uniref:Rv1733c family protein n=1 Tax=Streptomyces sp. 351MFTsu5.1 TaxID=1172180 RepID=UPI00036BE344|nr:hypothetical protein [Streptomyces sp. 351MFTsu5.1]